jgi:hypothetical protein
MASSQISDVPYAYNSTPHPSPHQSAFEPTYLASKQPGSPRFSTCGGHNIGPKDADYGEKMSREMGDRFVQISYDPFMETFVPHSYRKGLPGNSTAERFYDLLEPLAKCKSEEEMYPIIVRASSQLRLST